MRRLVVLLMLLVAVASAQQTDSQLVIKTTTRLVQLDVVVTDKNGDPIRGLQGSDFTVLQDGKPQSITFFDTHASTPSSPTAAAAAPNVFSNEPKDASSPSWTILLLDMLNTPTTDQMAAREQLIKVIHSLPAGHPVALFTLTSQLTLVQGFSSQPGALLQAVRSLKIVPSKLLTTEAKRQQQVGELAYLSNTSRGSIPSSAPVSGNTGAANLDVAGFGDRSGGHGIANVSRWMQGYNQMESIRSEERIIFTLDALSAISRAVSGYPGRKNMVWLSGGFPIRLGPNAGDIDPWRNDANYSEASSRASSLLSDSRVAVYPVDIRGSQTHGVKLETSTSASQVYTGIIAGDAPNTISTDGMSNLIAEESLNKFNEFETLFELAQQTGGRAFVNTNDFGDAILRSIADGTNYYTLAFVPPKTSDKLAYHTLTVRLNRADAKLNYRRGYFTSSHAVATPQVGAATLQGAMQPGMPPSTSLLFSVHVDPPKPGNTRVVLTYTINPGNIHFSDDVNGSRKVTIDCLAIAFDSKGKTVSVVSDTMEGSIQSSHFEEVLKNGLPATQELQLPPGTYYLKTGIMDRSSSEIGTLDIPLVVPALTF